MDIESIQVAQLLMVIAETNEKFIAFSQDLRSRPEVIRVLHSFECRKYGEGVGFEGYVDAELHNGRAVCWWLEVHWSEERWLIESRILVNSDQGQDPIKEFPEKVSDTLGGFIAQLEQVIAELVGSIGTIDLTSANLVSYSSEACANKSSLKSVR